MTLPKTYYRAVFISDTHLGFKSSNVQALSSFLKTIECDYLYLVGDIFDLWAMKKKIYWTAEATKVIRNILKFTKHGTKIIYIPGNHDEGIRHFVPLTLGEEIKIVNEAFHTTTNGTKFLVIHGDQFDVVVGKMKWLAVLGSTIYDWLIVLNGVVHTIRKKLKFQSYWSLSSFLKHKAKQAISYIHDFESAVAHHAIKNHCSGAICGHIHTAKIEKIVADGQTVIYGNCGDWVESLTALVETGNGELKLIKWHDIDYSL